MKNSLPYTGKSLLLRVLSVAFMLACITAGHAERTYKTIWSGEKAIDWAGFHLPARLFEDLSAGDRLRYVYKDLTLGGTSHLNCGYANGEEIMPINGYLGLQSVSYQITLTEAVLESVRTHGMWVYGKGHTLTELQVFNPSVQGVDGEILTDDIHLI